MKKLIIILVILITFYISYNIITSFFSKGYKIKYKISNFEIEETYVRKTNREITNYYLEIKVNDKIFSIQTFYNFNNSKKIIKAIKYIKSNNYECIYPIFKDDVQISDMLCMNNGIIYNYSSIKNKDINIDEFAQSLEKKYKLSNYIDKKEILEKKDNSILYNNIVKNHYIGIENYKGLYIIDEKINKKNLFKKDSYIKNIHAFNNKYYVVADYNNEYEFNVFNVINLTTNKKDKIISNKAISFDSYIQGFVDNCFYLIDKNNVKQYEINMKKKIVKEIGNSNDGMKIYENDEWKKGNIYDAIKDNIYFSNYEKITKDSYYKIEKYGNKKSGFYYMYKKSGDTYYVYKTNIQNDKIIKYLFSTKDIDKIVYIEDYIYYQDGFDIKYYHDTGTKTIFTNNELNFNHNLIFGIYTK